MAKPKPSKLPAKPSAKARRSAARLAAVQALYQMAQTGQGAERVLGEFIQHRFGVEQDGDTMVSPEPALFGRIVRGTSVRRFDIDRIIDASLSTGRGGERVETLLRCVMRAGVWELGANADVPAPIVITEYVNVADAFFSGPEPGIVNGVLDRVAHRLREGEAGLKPERAWPIDEPAAPDEGAQEAPGEAPETAREVDPEAKPEAEPEKPQKRYGPNTLRHGGAPRDEG